MSPHGFVCTRCVVHAHRYCQRLDGVFCECTETDHCGVALRRRGPSHAVSATEEDDRD